MTRALIALLFLLTASTALAEGPQPTASPGPTTAFHVAANCPLVRGEPLTLNVETSLAEIHRVSVRLYDPAGKQVASCARTLHPLPGQLTCRIGAQHPPGSYTIRVRVPNERWIPFNGLIENTVCEVR